MARSRTHLVLYAVVLREHPEIVKIGRTTNWNSRRREYDTWNFADGNGVLAAAVYCITEEYVDLPALESACLYGMGFFCAKHRGNEWFKGDIEVARKVIEDVLHTAQVSYADGPARKRN